MTTFNPQWLAEGGQAFVDEVRYGYEPEPEPDWGNPMSVTLVRPGRSLGPINCDAVLDWQDDELPSCHKCRHGKSLYRRCPYCADSEEDPGRIRGMGLKD